MRKSWLVVLVALIPLLYGLPFWLSSHFGNQLLLRWIEKKYDCLIDKGTLHLHWQAPQILHQFHLTKEGLSVSAEKILIDQSLFSLVRGVNRLNVDGLNIDDRESEEISSAKGSFQRNLSFTFSGQTRIGDISGFFTAEGHRERDSFILNAEAEHVPLPLVLKAVDLFAFPIPIDTESLGDNLSLKAQTEAEALTLQASTEKSRLNLIRANGEIQAQAQLGELSLTDLTLSWSNGWKLLKPLSFDYHPQGKRVLQGEVSSLTIPKTEKDPLALSCTFNTLPQALGKTGQCEVQGQEGKWQGTFKSDLLTLNSQGDYAKGKVTSDRFKYLYTLTPSLFNDWAQKLALTLSEATQLTGEIAPFSLDFTSADFTCRGNLTASPISLLAKKTSQTLILEKTHLKSYFDYKKRIVGFSLDSRLNNEGAVTTEGEFVYGKMPQGSCDFTLNRIALSLLKDLLFPQIPLQIAPQDLASLKAKVKWFEEERLVDLKIESQALLLEAACDLTGDLTLNHPGTLTIKMLPQNATGPTSLRIKMEKLNWPLIHSPDKFWPQFSSELKFVSLKGFLSLDPLTLAYGAQRAKIEKLGFDIEKDPLSSSIGYKGQTLIEDGSQKGSIELKGTVVNRDNRLVTNLDSTWQKVPIQAIDLLLISLGSQTQPCKTLFGDSLNIAIQGDFSAQESHFNALVDTPQLKTQASASIAKGLLYLEKNLEAELILTPNLSDLLFKNSDFKLLSTQKPIIVSIASRGFSLPIWPFEISGFNAPFITVDLGQSMAANIGNSLALGLLFKFPPQNQLFLWWAPMKIQAQNGLMKVGRTEILLSPTSRFDSGLDVATWGKIDLVRRSIDMTLGLTAQSLQSALGIQGLNPSYVLKVPMKGAFGHVKIATDKALAKLALLIARQQAKPHAGAWGEVLDAFGQITDDQSDVPPPQRPFPWERR